MTSKLGLWSAAAMSVAATACISCGQTAFAQEETDQRFGTVHFATSCNETAQRRFDRGMRYQHSFWYRESKEIFEEAVKADPECEIAYWGIALSLLNNPHNPPPAPNLPLGLAAIQKAKAVSAKTERGRLGAGGGLCGLLSRLSAMPQYAIPHSGSALTASSKISFKFAVPERMLVAHAARTAAPQSRCTRDHEMNGAEPLVSLFLSEGPVCPSMRSAVAATDMAAARPSAQFRCHGRAPLFWRRPTSPCGCAKDACRRHPL